jgi:branched-chain amino acid transport system ATP-binding protein
MVPVMVSRRFAPIIVQQVYKVITTSPSGTTMLLVEQNAHKALFLADRYVLETGSHFGCVLI